MQSFLGISPASAPLGAPSASDASTNDARSASDPANGDAFRTALNAANQRSDGAGTTERPSRRPTTSTSKEATATDDDVAADGESPTDAATPDEALAMLLTWLVPVAPTPTPTTPVLTALAGTGDAPLTTAPIGTAADGALMAKLGTLSALSNGPATGSIAQNAFLADATGTDSLADTTGSIAGATAQTTPPAATAPGATTAGQADATLAGAVPAAADGIPLTGMTAADATATTAPAPATATAPTTAPTTLTPDILAAMQATAEAQAADAAAQSAAPASNTASGQATGPATDMAGLAAEFGAQIVATTGQTGTRTASPGATPTGPAAIGDAQAPTTGSTAQAAGAGTSPGIQLPGQAVAAAGASAQGSGGTLAEALEAGPDGVSATQADQDGAEAPTTFQATLGAASPHGVGQAQDVDTTQASPTTAPPIANQIADGALAASRRNGQSVEMILQPEGLGSISLRVTAERAGLAVHMSIENPHAREMVQASWPQLQQALEQRGLTVQSLLLDLSNNGGGGESFQAFQQFSSQQQFNGQQGRGGSPNGDRRGGLSIASVDEGTRTQSEARVASRVDYRI